MKGGAIVNPAKLDAARRDAVCMQCHLEGKAAIERPGRHIYDFQPGEQLSDYIRYFVFADQQGSGLGAVSQFEALAHLPFSAPTSFAILFLLISRAAAWERLASSRRWPKVHARKNLATLCPALAVMIRTASHLPPSVFLTIGRNVWLAMARSLEARITWISPTVLHAICLRR